MSAEARMKLIEYRELQGVDHAADRVDDTTGKKPGKCLRTHEMINATDREDAEPAHGNVDGGIEPFRGIYPADRQKQSGKCKTPDDSAQRSAGACRKHKHADRSIASGNQEIDHDVIQLLEQKSRFVVRDDRMVKGAGTVQKDHAQNKKRAGDHCFGVFGENRLF